MSPGVKNSPNKPAGEKRRRIFPLSNILRTDTLFRRVFPEKESASVSSSSGEALLPAISSDTSCLWMGRYPTFTSKIYPPPS